MKKTLLAIACTSLFAYNSQAQEVENNEPHTKKIEHSVGIQINELIRQVFNFNNTAVSTNNPFLLTYNINLAKSGWGLRLGAGCVFKGIEIADGISTRSTNNNDVNARLGIEKRFNLSTRWVAGVGIDGVFNSINDYSSSIIRSFDTTSTNTHTFNRNYGGGAMCWLRYNISEHVQVGTEASFYYLMGDQKEVVSITQRNQTAITPRYVTKTSIVDNKVKDGEIRLPVVFYLLVRF